jgi:hypothetical protein
LDGGFQGQACKGDIAGGVVHAEIPVFRAVGGPVDRLAFRGSFALVEDFPVKDRRLFKEWIGVGFQVLFVRVVKVCQPELTPVPGKSTYHLPFALPESASATFFTFSRLVGANPQPALLPAFPSIVATIR